MYKCNIVLFVLILSACRSFREQGKSESSRMIDRKNVSHVMDSSFWNTEFNRLEYWRIKSDSLMAYDLKEGYIFGKGTEIEKWQSVAKKGYHGNYSDTMMMQQTEEKLSQMTHHKNTQNGWDSWLWFVGALVCVILLSPMLGKALSRK
jgi:hypothetical protein